MGREGPRQPGRAVTATRRASVAVAPLLATPRAADGGLVVCIDPMRLLPGAVCRCAAPRLLRPCHAAAVGGRGSAAPVCRWRQW